MSEHPSITRFRTVLTDLGGQGRIVVLPGAVHTAALAAEALGCEVGAIANSLLFEASTQGWDEQPAEHSEHAKPAEHSEHSEHAEPVLVLTSGAHRVDTAKVAADLGLSRLRRASARFVREHTGQVIGGVSPIGHPRPVRTYIDPTLREYEEVWAAAGHPAAVFSTTYDELLAMTHAQEIEVN
ncbi:MAG: YbaK/EbsC family protein [Micrococcales bacterium]|nr:YbaK/EbsC family protein [Micrococcales bacterium]